MISNDDQLNDFCLIPLNQITIPLSSEIIFSIGQVLACVMNTLHIVSHI
jgi:hypothetical protein